MNWILPKVMKPQLPPIPKHKTLILKPTLKDGSLQGHLGHWQLSWTLSSTKQVWLLLCHGKIKLMRESFCGESSRSLHCHLPLTVLNVFCYLYWVLITSCFLLCRQICLELFWSQHGHGPSFTLFHSPWFLYWWEIINEDKNEMNVPLKKIKWPCFHLYISNSMFMSYFISLLCILGCEPQNTYLSSSVMMTIIWFFA